MKAYLRSSILKACTNCLSNKHSVKIQTSRLMYEALFWRLRHKGYELLILSSLFEKKNSKISSQVWSLKTYIHFWLLNEGLALRTFSFEMYLSQRMDLLGCGIQFYIKIHVYFVIPGKFLILFHYLIRMINISLQF